jgi:L-rhamnonate dehydratase
MLLGRRPCDTTANWERLYEGTASPGRRGIAVHAISAIDMALHDLAGKQLGLPVYQLLGGARQSSLSPYATIFPGMAEGRSLSALMDDIIEKLHRAVALGYRAVKMEVLFGDLASDRDVIDCIRQGRAAVADDITFMVDFGYRWTDWQDASRTLDRVADCDLYFAEATLPHDDLISHASLAAVSPVRICGAEWAVTRWEIREWIEHGKVSVVQPDISRCGGFTEIRRIAEMCALHGVQCIPHGWKTGILAVAGMHAQAALPNIPFIEFMPASLYPSPLRSDLVSPEPTVANGTMPLPLGSGLGLTLNQACVDLYRMA